MPLGEISEKTEMKKKEVIAAARVVFRKYGFKKATIVDIAKEINLNQATLYHYFDNKEEIFIESVLAEHAEFRNQQVQSLQNEDTIQRKLAVFFGQKLSFFYLNRIQEQISELNVNKINDSLKKKLENLSWQEHETVGHLIEIAIQGGELPTYIDAYLLTKLVFRIFQGLRVENKFKNFVSRQEPRTDLLIQEMEQSIRFLFDNLNRSNKT